MWCVEKTLAVDCGSYFFFFFFVVDNDPVTSLSPLLNLPDQYISYPPSQGRKNRKEYVDFQKTRSQAAFIDPGKSNNPGRQTEGLPVELLHSILADGRGTGARRWEIEARR